MRESITKVSIAEQRAATSGPHCRVELYGFNLYSLEKALSKHELFAQTGSFCAARIRIQGGLADFA